MLGKLNITVFFVDNLKVPKLLGWIRLDQEPNTRDVDECKNQIEHREQNSSVL